MFPARRAISFSNGELLHFLFKQNPCHALSSISSNVIQRGPNEELLQKNSFNGHLRRPLHVTVVNRDLEAGLRAIGAGVATSAMIGPGVGIGIIFGNFLNCIARNPSIANKALGNAIMGAAFCESLGLFALVLAFIIMP